MPSRDTAGLRPQPALPTRVARELGVTPSELQGPRWRHPHRGVVVPVGTDPDDPLQRIYDVAELLPAGCAIGGWAAAFLHGSTDLDGRGLSGRDRWPVPILLPPRLHLARRQGVVAWRSRFGPEDVVEIAGVPVTEPARTAFDLGRKSRSLDAAVAGLDVLGRQSGLDLTAVADYARRRPRWGGLPRLRTALDLADPRSRSAGESRFRVLWVRDAGLPRPECNPLVADLDGMVVGMPDLFLADCGLAGEYDGALHRDLHRHTDDNSREESLEELGLVVVRATVLDVGPRRAQTADRLIRAYARARNRSGPPSWLWRAAAPPRLVR